jgi:hypothetical protein
MNAGALAELGRERLKRRLPRARQQNSRTLVVERAGDGPADAAGGSGYERGLAGKIEHAGPA